MAPSQFGVRDRDDARFDELLGIKRAVDRTPEPKTTVNEWAPPDHAPTGRKGVGKALLALEVVSVVGLYAAMTAFTARLVGSQGTGAMGVILTALGGIFEITKITLIIEAVKRKSPLVALIACVFMAISFSGSALNMLSSWKATASAAQADPDEVVRRELSASIASLRAQEAQEAARLGSGSVQYRTDAENTRASLEAIRAEIDRKVSELAAVPAPKTEVVQAENGFFGVLPLPQERKSTLELWFRVAMAAALELGGLAGIVLLSRRGQNGKTDQA